MTTNNYLYLHYIDTNNNPVIFSTLDEQQNYYDIMADDITNDHLLIIINVVYSMDRTLEAQFVVHNTLKKILEQKGYVFYMFTIGNEWYFINSRCNNQEDNIDGHINYMMLYYRYNLAFQDLKTKEIITIDNLKNLPGSFIFTFDIGFKPEENEILNTCFVFNKLLSCNSTQLWWKNIYVGNVRQNFTKCASTNYKRIK